MSQERPQEEHSLSQASKLSFGDTLHDVLVRTIEADRSPGLLPLQFPTGAGKSYAVEQTIATLVSNMPEGAPPILFVTPQKKNIPSVEKIAGLCKQRGYEVGPHDVMRLYSASEMLAMTVNDELLESVPHEHRRETAIDDLVDMVKLFNQDKRYNDLIQKPVRDFKRSVRSLLPNVGWEERLELIEQDSDWQWLGRLWPFVYTRRAKVLLMTSKKFFLPHDTLLEAACPICEADWIRGSVIFVDEFDATKRDCLDVIVSNSTRYRADLPGLVRSLVRGVDMSKLPESMTSGNNAKRLGQLRSALTNTTNEANVDYVYKAEEGAIGSAGLFMYDGIRYGTSIGTPLFVRTDVVRKENVIVGRQSKKDELKSLAFNVGKFRGAVTYAQRTIVSMLREAHGYGLDGMDEEALRNEIFSILETLGVRERNERLLMFDGVSELLRSGGHGQGPLDEGQTLYEQGFGLVAIEESESHRFSTHIYAYALNDTPEKRMRALIERSLVIGLSATACVDSPLCNYDLDWLEEQRPALMRSLTDEDTQRLEAAYARHVRGYDKVNIEVVPISVAQTVDGGFYRETASLLHRQTLQEKAQNLLAGVPRTEDGKLDEYVVLRYLRVAKAYLYFIQNIPAGVFVCATSAAPRTGNNSSDKYREEVLKTLFELIRKDLEVVDSDDSVCFFGGSDNFQDEYDSAVSKLGDDCTRMFICASYETLATGVNLQYDGKGMVTVDVGDHSFDSSSAYIDLVGVYLDRITSVAPAYTRIREEARAEDILRCAYELREMSWQGEISLSEMEIGVRSLINRKQSKVKLVDKSSVMAACTRMATQMIGRMCRTSHKAPTIHVLYDQDLSSRIDPYAMGDTLIGIETEKFLAEIAAKADCKPEELGVVENKMATRAMRTENRLSSFAQRSKWSEEDMVLWEEMRTWCLGHPCPTPADLAGSRLFNYYLDVGHLVSAYRYYETGDFKDVGVSFDPTVAEDYPCEVSDRAARLDVLASLPETRALFQQRGWPLKWEPSTVVMNPAFFRGVYLGAIGEQAGKAILETHVRDLVLNQITDPRKYEKFDFVVGDTDVYVDFKFWRSPDSSGERYVARIREKMQRVDATHALIINLMCGDVFRDKKCEEMPGNILSVPYLIDDKESCVCVTHVVEIRNWLRKVGALQ